ncbi:PTS sugar transporter subunit IIA [Pseudalkalibacillus sp. R45]|uniref:PTS sugar transporter subunit IIA n=1 Tax=Pseudalkalibacillus sp. R45 TaxID=3457433 RepID=UPI003FCE2115
MRFLDERVVRLDVDISSPEEAIKQAGYLLVEADIAEERYVKAMMDSYKKNGPYFVLAPNIALPHARPEDGAKESAVSLIRLKKPISFGHASNDPVQLVFALSATSSDQHLIVLQKLMKLLGNPDNVSSLIRLNSKKDLQSLLGGIVL